MGILFVPVTFLSLIAGAAAAYAETRIFIVENQRDGYGIDQCLASGASCGKPVASAYCHARNYDQALSFRKIDPDKNGQSGTVETGCRSSLCTQFVAIECAR